MKKAMMMISGLFLILLSTTEMKAQSASGEYFIGKWDVLTQGTPSGDAHSVLTLERNADGKLVGTFQKKDGAVTSLTRVEEKEKSITAYFAASGYDVYLFLEKTADKDKIEGSMMDMFDSFATRIIEEKK